MYCQYPTLWKDSLVFVSDNTLWQISIKGGRPQRLSERHSHLAWPVFDPTGRYVAFTGGKTPGIYLLDREKSYEECLCLSSQESRLLGWLDKHYVLYASTVESPFRESHVYALHVKTGQEKKFSFGPCEFLSYGGPFLQKDPQGECPQDWKKDISLNLLEKKNPGITPEPLGLHPCVLQRGGYGFSSWRDYQGGLTGNLWIDAQGTGDFQPLLSHIKHNMIRPILHGGRVYFASDHQGAVGNIYSCTAKGEDLQQHTHSTDYYIHHHQLALSQDNASGVLVYSHGGDLYTLDLDTNVSQKVDIPQDGGIPETYTVAQNPKEKVHFTMPSSCGKFVATIVRGRLFFMTPTKGPVTQLGQTQGYRYAHGTWLANGQFCALRDDGLQDLWEIYDTKRAFLTKEPEKTIVFSEDLGRILHIYPHPKKPWAVVQNHRHQLILLKFLDQGSPEVRFIVHSTHGPISNFSWSPCGVYGVYDHGQNLSGSALCVYDVLENATHRVLEGCYFNSQGFFDPQGRYLYCLSQRHLKVSWDDLHMNLACSTGNRPMVMVLKENLKAPCDALYYNAFTAPEEEDSSSTSKEEGESSQGDTLKLRGEEKSQDIGNKKNSDCQKDISHEEENSLGSPDALEDSQEIQKPKEEKSSPSHEALEKPKDLLPWSSLESAMLELKSLPLHLYEGFFALDKDTLGYVVEGDNGTMDLYGYCFSKEKERPLLRNIESFQFSPNGEYLVTEKQGIHRWHKVQQLSSGGETEDEGGNDGGTVLNINGLSLRTSLKWDFRHMLKEAWRLQKEFFHCKERAGPQWTKILDRYLPLVEKISTYDELWSILLDMQGELRSSHAYVVLEKQRELFGSLGVDLVYDGFRQCYRVGNFIGGTNALNHPLKRPGISVKPGDVLLSIEGYDIVKNTDIGEHLKGKIGRGVSLVFGREKSQDPSCPKVLLPEDFQNHNSEEEISSNLENTINNGAENITPEEKGGEYCPHGFWLSSLERFSVVAFPVSQKQDHQWRYEAWVQKNRTWVHDHSYGAVGYVHIPDMDTYGYQEFLQGYMAEFNRKGLIVDARYNGGGNISYFILDLLGRRRLGYDHSRHYGTLPYPSYSSHGHYVFLINGATGSDGDIFAHCVKELGLGPTIGETTWGGTVGIMSIGQGLIGNIRTYQPAFPFTFTGEKRSTENFGVDPDIFIVNTPGDYHKTHDAQLQRALEEIQKKISS